MQTCCFRRVKNHTPVNVWHVDGWMTSERPLMLRLEAAGHHGDTMRFVAVVISAVDGCLLSVSLWSSAHRNCKNSLLLSSHDSLGFCPCFFLYCLQKLKVLFAVGSDGEVSEPLEVTALNCDTVEQVKEKILTTFKAKFGFPYNSSLRDVSLGENQTRVLQLWHYFTFSLVNSKSIMPTPTFCSVFKLFPKEGQFLHIAPLNAADIPMCMSGDIVCSNQGLLVDPTHTVKVVWYNVCEFAATIVPNYFQCFSKMSWNPAVLIQLGCLINLHLNWLIDRTFDIKVTMHSSIRSLLLFQPEYERDGSFVPLEKVDRSSEVMEEVTMLNTLEHYKVRDEHLPPENETVSVVANRRINQLGQRRADLDEFICK